MSSLLRGARACLTHFSSRITTSSTITRAHVGRGPQTNAAWSRCISSTLSQNQNDFDGRASNINASSSVESLSAIDRQLELMDSHVRWRGRIDREDVEEVLKHVKTEGKITEQQSLMLLRCTGALLVKEHPMDRLKIFTELWNELKNIGVPMKTSHFNASLRIQLENKSHFSPSEMLAEMEASPSSAPNRITYQLLMARFCEEGDIEGATKVLQHMKNENMSINETVFNSLVKGHMKNGDIDGAKSVMESMRSVGLEPTAETYNMMMCCQAEKGDLDGIRETRKQAAADEVNFLPRHYYSVVTELAESGHSGAIPEILEMLPARNGYNHDTLNCMHQLVARGKDEVARLVLNQLSGEYENSNLLLSGSRSLFRDMVMKNRPLEVLEKMLAEMQAEGKTTDDISLIALLALRYQKPEMALASFQRMKTQSRPIRPHFFWPVFITYKKAGNKEGLYTAAGEMARLTEDNTELVSALYSNVFLPLEQLGDDPTTIITKLQEQGIKAEDAMSMQFLHIIENGQLAEACTLVENVTKVPSQRMMKFIIVKGATISQDWTSLMQLLSKLQIQKKIGSLTMFNGQVLESLCKSSSLGESELTKLVQAWVAEGLNIGNTESAAAKKLLKKSGVANDVIETLSSVTAVDNRVRRSVVSSSDAMHMSIEDLETALEDPSRSTDRTTIKKWLLNKYCDSGNIEKANEIKATLDSQGFIYRAEMLRQFASLAAKDKQNLEEALKYKQEMETKFPEFSAYAGLTLQISTLQIGQGKTTDALENLKEYGSRHQTELTEHGFGEAFQLSAYCTDLVEASRKHAPASFTQELVETLFNMGFIKTGTFRLLEQVLKAYMEKDDTDGMMAYFEQCLTQYNRTPVFSDIFKLLIKREDAEKLQKVVDMVSSVYGEMPVLHHLVLNLIECGKVKQARRILETPGLRAVMPVLQSGCERFVVLRKEQELKQLVDITRDLFAVNRDEMLFSLIRLYAHEEDTKKCLDVLASYEDERCLPSDRTLRYTAKVLESCGEEVPFAVPEITQKQSFQSLQPSNPLEEECHEALTSGDIARAIDIVSKSGEAGQTLSPDFLASVAVGTLRNASKQEFKSFAYTLGQEGHVEALKLLQDTDVPPTLIRFISQRLFIAYIFSGRAEEIVTELGDNPAKVAEYTTTQAIQQLAEKSPELLPQLETLIQQEVVKPDANIISANHLFNYYVLTDQIAKAQDLLKSSPYLKAGLKLMIVSEQLRKEENESRLLALLDIVDGLAIAKFGVIYSQLVYMKTKAGDVQGAMAYVEKAKERGLDYPNLWGVALHDLEQKLLAENQNVPWEVGRFSRGRSQTQPKVADVTTDSDSSDSSDDEEKKQQRK